MRFHHIALAVLLALPAFLPAAGEGQSRDVVIGAREVYSQAITSWNGRIEIRGAVTDTVLMMGGKLVLSGEIRGDLVCIGTDVDIQGQAQIQRDVIIIGGTLHRSETSRIRGEFFFIRTKEDFKKILGSLMPFLPGTGGLVFFKIIKTVFWFILMLLVLAIFPRRVNESLKRFASTWPRCGAVGMLTFISFLLLLVLFVILSFIFIGIPLLLLLIAFYFVLLTYGRTVVLGHIGQRLLRYSGLKTDNPVFWLVSGTLLYMLFKFLPYAGAVMLIGVDVFALGIGLTILRRTGRSGD